MSLPGALSSLLSLFLFFFFNDTATTEIYTLSLHDALPISRRRSVAKADAAVVSRTRWAADGNSVAYVERSEEHTSELQSHVNLVCRLLLEKKKKGRGMGVEGEKEEREGGVGR